MNRFEARTAVLNELQKLGLFINKKPHEMSIPLCSRTGDILEPMLKDQWFLRSEEMFKECKTAVESGVLQLIPEWRANLWNQYASTYSKDWCISRQLWWGQQIPAYKCTLKKDSTKSKWFVGRTENEAKVKAIEHFKTDQISIEQGELN
jgi:valyl-tRNA synthetase